MMPAFRVSGSIHSLLLTGRVFTWAVPPEPESWYAAPALSVLCHALYLTLGLPPWVRSGLAVRVEL